MQTACDLLVKDIGAPCDTPDVGLKRKGYIFNYDDVVGTLELRAGAKGYRFIQGGKQPFNGTNSALVVGAFRSTYTHEVKAVIFDKEVVEQLRGGRFVVVVDRGKTGDDSSNESFVCFGLRLGMFLNEATQDYYSEDTGAGWNVTLQEQGGKMAENVFSDMSYKDASAALEAMCGEVADGGGSSTGSSASVTGEVLTVGGSVSDEMLTLTKGSVSSEVLTI